MKSINQKLLSYNKWDLDQDRGFTKITLINETSVYREYLILKENSLDVMGHFDLIQVPNLRVFSGKLLKNLRLNNNLTLKAFSKKYNISWRALYHWENNRTAIPLTTFLRITKENKIYSQEIYILIKKGILQTKKNVNLSFKYDELKKYLPFISLRGKNELIVKQTGKKYSKKIQELFNLKLYISTNKQIVIKNVDLHNFFKTFFDKVLRVNITFPLTDFLDKLNNIDFKKAIICPILQTDGCGCYDKRKKRYFISFKNISKELHNIFVESMYKTYNFLPSFYLLNEKIDVTKHTECFITKYAGEDFQNIYRDLIKICGNFKTSKYYKQSIREYSKEAKPNLNYLLSAKNKEKAIALRIWASTEGAIIPMRRNKDGLIVPKLQISCSNKDLLFQLQKISKSLGLHFTVRYENGKYKSIYNMSISCALNFIKLGGFIEGVKLNKSSKYYEGIEKQDLLFATLEYMVRERKDSLLRNIPMKEVHRNIRKIAKNCSYKKLDYYINFFSQNKKVKKCLN